MCQERDPDPEGVSHIQREDGDVESLKRFVFEIVPTHCGDEEKGVPALWGSV